VGHFSACLKPRFAHGKPCPFAEGERLLHGNPQVQHSEIQFRSEIRTLPSSVLYLRQS